MTDIPQDVFAAAEAAFEDCRGRNEHADAFRAGACCLRAAITAALEVDAAEQWAERQAEQLGLKYADFRAGKWEMELSTAREMGAAYTAMAKTLLGDAPNYTETKICFDTKIAESPEMYTLVVQRHAPGALTPHEARQKAETRVAKLEAELADAKRPSYSERHVWAVWREDQPIHAHYATEDDARQGSIDCWEEDEPACPDYSWSKDGPRLELVVGGEAGGVYISRHDVFGQRTEAGESR